MHAGCNAEDLGWVGRMLDTYPNLHIDIAARLSQLGRQPRATRELVLRHPDRVLFGCDEIPHTGASYPTHFRFLETEDEHFPHSADDPPLMGRWAISGHRPAGRRPARRVRRQRRYGSCPACAADRTRTRRA